MGMPKGTVCHQWTDAERARLAEIAPGRTHEQIREIMTAEFGDCFGGKRIGAALKRYGIKTGLTGRFEKGCAGGFKDEKHRRAFLEAGRATRFKHGEVHGPAGHVKPVGFERVDAKDGYLWVKVKDTPQLHEPGHFNDNFRLKHHVVWEEANGRPVPPHTMIVFADRDKRNLDPSNLVAVPRSLWAVISQKHLAYCDAESLRTAMNVARLDRARYGAKKRMKEARA